MLATARSRCLDFGELTHGRTTKVLHVTKCDGGTLRGVAKKQQPTRRVKGHRRGYTRNRETKR